MSEVLPRRRILVTGATGQQGGATVTALQNYLPTHNLEILALTRNSQSNSARALAQKHHVKVLVGDLSDIEAVFEQVGGIGSVWGVFSVQALEFIKNPAEGAEVKHGCALIDAAIKYQVQHFVQTGVDRGGIESDKNPTYVNHFVSKHIIETYLVDQTQNSNMTYTILRPVAFMDMLRPDVGGRLFGGLWKSELGDVPWQLIATKDIGEFAAQAFISSETDEYKNQALSIAGDELTFAQANEVFWKELHRPMPVASSLVLPLFKFFVPEVGTMFKWFAETGYGADIEKCRKLKSGMLDLGAFLKEDGRFSR